MKASQIIAELFAFFASIVCFCMGNLTGTVFFGLMAVYFAIKNKER